jgi:thiol-disulfide isomerase/thioredoxin
MESSCIKYFVLLIFITHCFVIVSNCQDSCELTIKISKSIDVEKLNISINDGVNNQKLSTNGSIYDYHYRGKVYSAYGFITFQYLLSDTTHITAFVFFNKGKGRIFLQSNIAQPKRLYIDSVASANVFSYSQMGGNLLDSFIKNERNAVDDFIRDNKSKFSTNNELVLKAMSLYDSLAAKKIAFIRTHPDQFISFWIFQNEIIKGEMLTPDSLMSLYNKTLSPRYKNSYAGASVSKIIQNKINVTTKSTFPNFVVTDIHNKQFSLSNSKENFILIHVWASWCLPCIKELPYITAINKKYKKYGLKIISCSIDNNFYDARSIIKKYKMTWTNIVGDNQLYNSLSNLGVPQLYLLDSSHNVIYNSFLEKDPQLNTLNKIINLNSTKHFK